MIILIKKAIIEEWDPIGVGYLPEAQDEYDSYISMIYELLFLRRPKSEIFDFLWWVETQHMGLKGEKIKTEQFAQRLIDLTYKNIHAKSNLSGDFVRTTPY